MRLVTVANFVPPEEILVNHKEGKGRFSNKGGI